MNLIKYITSGVFLAIVGVVMFSAKAVIVKMAYKYNVSSMHLLLFRMLFSLPFYLVLMVVYKKKEKEIIKKKDYLWIFFFGFIGYYLASYFDFLGLQYIKASLERIILFVYPTLVLLLSRLIFKTKINSKQVVAIILTYLGVLITFWGEVDLKGDEVVLGGFLIFLSALTYASYLVGSGWLIPKFGVVLFTSYAMIISTVCVIIHYLIIDRSNILIYNSEVYFLAFIMAVVSTLIPSFLVSAAIKKINAQNFSIIGSIGPISTILLAYFFLGESLSYLQIIGTIVVIAGIFFVSKSKNRN